MTAPIDPAYGFERLSTDRYPTKNIITTLRSIPLENLLLTFAEDPSVYHYVLELAARFEELAVPADPDVVAEEPAPDDRTPNCVALWPQCKPTRYDPRCCRFPKSCSCWRTEAAGPSPEEESHA